jgi:hypothetical protein
VPAWVGIDRPTAAGSLVAVTRTRDELSIVCSQRSLPEPGPGRPRCELGWRAIAVRGPLDFSLTGVVASLTVPLANAGVPVFVVSTFDTDYVLVKDEHLDAARAALRAAGHR